MGRPPLSDKNGLKKGPWTPEEDAKLTEYIRIHGPGNWRTLPTNAGLNRCGKSCRLRWTNYLRPDIKRGSFSFEEEETIIQLHSVLGNKWSSIAARLPGRTDNEIKNYWNTHIRKRLLKSGIDPVTHSPRLDHLDLSSILNLSNLLNLQTLVNPEVLKLATLLASSNEENLMSHMDQTLTNHQLPNGTSMPTSLPSNHLLNKEGHAQYLSPSMNGQAVDENLMPPCLPDNHGILPTQNFNLDSVLSTPMSSPRPLNSSSTLVNSSSSTEDDRETYCSLFKFEIPESFEFDDFM